MRRSTPNRSRAFVFAIAVAVAWTFAGEANASCQDPAAIATGRAAVEASCDCAAAASPRAWRSCVHAALAPLVGGTLSRACASWVERLEVRSTCGHADRVACCRTSASGITRPLLRRDGQCVAPPGGSACESPRPVLADACVPGGCASPPVCGNSVVEAGEQCDPPDGVSCSVTCTTCSAATGCGATCGDYAVDPGEQCDPPDGLYCSPTCTACTTELGCVPPTSCGNGTLDAGESCDPPNGTTCSSTCSSCAPAAPGELLLGCTSGGTGALASALPDTLLVTYTDVTPGSAAHVRARRLANDGALLDAAPLLVSGPLAPSGGLGGWATATTASSDEFYVTWATYREYVSLWGARRIPPAGPITADAEQIASHFAFGSCRTSLAGPDHLAPTLDDLQFHSTWRVVYSCLGDVLAETLLGVGSFFQFPPPGNTSWGPAPIVRGASDVAAAWWNVAIVSISPPATVPSLAASFVEPGTPEMILLRPGFSSVPPALAAIGDTFVAFFVDGSELRAIRFSRAGGVLDPASGILVASAANAIQYVVATGDGSAAVATWIESDGTIRAIRVAPDGSLPEPSPTVVATTTPGAGLDVAANPTTTLVVFTRDEGASRSVRGVLLPAS